MPPDLLDQAVEVVAEFAGESALPDSGWTNNGHQPGPLLARRGVEQILE